MSPNWLPLLVSWGALAVIVAVLAVYRNTLARKEDDHIHLADGESSMIPQQSAVAHRIEVVEKWGKSLTVVLLIYGLAVGAYYLYTVWQTQSSAQF